MDLYTEKKVSPKGKVNKTDLKKILRYTVIFFAAPTLIYLAQLQGTLSHNGDLSLVDFAFSKETRGAIYGWGLGIAINFFLRLNNNKQ